MNTDLTKFYRSKITWARGMYNQYASCQIIKFGLLQQIDYLCFNWRISIFICENWEAKYCHKLKLTCHYSCVTKWQDIPHRCQGCNCLYN